MGYYYAHTCDGRPNDGLKPEDYQMEQPRLLRRGGSVAAANDNAAGAQRGAASGLGATTRMPPSPTVKLPPPRHMIGARHL